MDLETLKMRKKHLGYTNAEISELTGIPLGTVNKIFSGATKSPSYDTMLKLDKILDFDVVKETSVKYRVNEDGSREWTNQGRYTVEDYYALPDDVRVELIDGVIYDMTAPVKKHQAIIGELHFRLLACAKSSKARCRVYVSPVDVRLDLDNRTMVQPDIVVVCHDDKNPKRFEGAPEFVIEVISPSTRGKDRVIKLNKYMAAGVKEYWIVDPYKEEVEVFILEKMNSEDFPGRYTFDDRIPVDISGGKCIIDFSRIKSDLADYDLEEDEL